LHAKTSERYDTITVRQHGAMNPQLVFPVLNTTVLGDGGIVSSELQTNIALEEVDIQVIYPIEETEHWVNDDFNYNETTGIFSFSVINNHQMEYLCSAQISHTYVEGLRQELVS